MELRCAFSPELLGGKTGADAGPIVIENYKRDKKGTGKGRSVKTKHGWEKRG